MVSFKHIRTVPLAYNDDCGLLGVGPDLDFYVEEIYGDEGWMAQYAYDFEGRRLDAVDEASGDNQGVERLPKPGNLARPQTGMSTIRLNFGGARHYGLREEDRIEDRVRPLGPDDKKLLVESGLLPPLAPPAILGLAQSYVTSEVRLAPPGRDRQPFYLLSRRLRVAYCLEERAVSDSGEMYDYTSQEFAVLQRYHPGDEGRPLAATMLTGAELGVTLNWPGDIVLRDDYLFVADSARGRDGLSSQIHIWRVGFS